MSQPFNHNIFSSTDLLYLELRVALHQHRAKIQDTIEKLKTENDQTTQQSIRVNLDYLNRTQVLYELVRENQSEFVNLINSLLEKKSAT